MSSGYYKNFLPYFILIVLIIALGVGMFFMKYHVLGLEKERSEIHRGIEINTQKIALLKGEWTRLNSAVRIKKLVEANNYASLDRRHMLALSNIPLKTAPASGMVQAAGYKEK